MKKWSYLFMLKEQQNPENNELIRTSLVRGRLMDKLAVELGMKNKQHSFFVTGLFSSIDTLLNRRMDTIIDELPLPLDVADALLGKNNINRRFLDYILSYEAGQWQQLENSDFFSQLPKDHFMRIYLDALQWSAVSMQLA